MEPGTGHSQRPAGSGRAIFVAGLMALCFVVVTGRAAYVALSGSIEVAVQVKTPPAPLRAAIEDRNGELLATTVTVHSLFADPSAIWDEAEVVRELKGVFPDLDTDLMVTRLSRKEREFEWVRRGLTPRQKADVLALGLEGLDFREERRRIYPHGSLAGHVLGYTNIDGAGIAGVEYSLNDRLMSGGDPVRLTIDGDVQFVLESELSNAAQLYNTRAGAGIVLQADTGEILGMASWPPLDPNRPSETEKEFRLSRASGAIFEMGSVFKPLTVAAALDAGVLSLSDRFDLREPVTVGPKVFEDTHHRYPAASLTDVIAQSSNVGTVRIGMRLGARRQQDFLRSLGLFERAQIEIPESSSPLLPPEWTDLATATVSFGHGMSVSAIAFTAGFASLANEGEYVTPTVLLERVGFGERRRVMAAPTAQVVLHMMRETVAHGTGEAADISGYRIAGKTGTAEKPTKEGYLEDRQNTAFAAIFPVDDPKYVVMILLDEPEGARETEDSAVHNAAPTAGRVIERIAPMLNVLPYFEDTAPASLHPDVRTVSEERRSL